MKILLIVHEYFPRFGAGTSVYTKLIAEELIKRGNEIVILSAEPASDLGDRNVTEYIENGVKIIKIHQQSQRNKTLSETYFSTFFDNDFNKILENEKPDIVHIQHLINFSLSFIEIIKKKNIPIIYTSHDLWYQCPNIRAFVDGKDCYCNPFRSNNWCSAKWVSGGVGYDKILIKPIKLLARLDWYIQRVLRQRVFRKYLGMVTHIITPSNYLKNHMVNFGIKKDSISVIQHGIDMPKNGEVSSEINNKKIRFVFAGVLDISKGLSQVVKVFKRIEKDYSNYELNIHGVYNTQDNELNGWINELKNIKNVTYHGGYSQSEKFSLYSKYDIMLLPAQWNDIYCLVLDEALAVNNYVIASDKGALPERIREGINGFNYNTTDDGLYSLITGVLKGDIKIPSIRERNEVNKLVLNTIETHVNSLEKVYEGV